MSVCKVMAFVTSVFVFGLLMLLCRGQPSKKVLHAYEELRGFLAKKSEKIGWFGQKSTWLQKKGVSFHFGAKIQLMEWIGTKLFLCCVGFLVGMSFSGICGLAGAIALFFLPEVLAVYLNHRDNERMLPEIRLIYHALEIQIRAGVYITDALTECYAGIQEKRLKQALLDLAGAVTMKADIYEALEQFQCKFDNSYIDSLCITILQALESGQAIELLKDIAEQVKDMEISVLNRKKGALDRSATFYQLGILAIVLGIVLYACITQMFTAALRF